MRRGLALTVVIGLVAALAFVWRCRSDQSPSPSAHRSMSKTQPAKRVVPIARGSISGTVVDDAKAPIAGAVVCLFARSDDLDPALLRDLPCVSSDASGAFTFMPLLPARYTVFASKASYQPKHGEEIVIDAAPAVVTLALARGGVEITGTVADLTGGPIEKARVRAKEAIVETRADGSFSLWVAPGAAVVSATADGYAMSREGVHAPGRVELFLIPEGTLSGTVVDAITKEPVEGARVVTEGSERDSKAIVMTDEHGAFRASRLPAGRYSVSARTEHGYGRSQGSVVVGVGAHVSGLVVKLHPAALVVGKVVISTTKQVCEEPSASLRDAAKDRFLHMSRRSAGTLVAEGVLPGTYAVEVTCKGSLERDTYPSLVVGTGDVSVVWEVDPGARITGTVRTESGAPVDDAFIAASLKPHDLERKWRPQNDRTDGAGHYEIAGLPAGTFDVRIRAAGLYDAEKPEEVAVAAGATIERDFVIPDGGVLRGSVVDDGGKPLAGVSINVDRGEDDERMDLSRSTDANGIFVIDRVRPGDYYVTAKESWRYKSKPVRSERISVRAKQTSTVTIVISKQDAGVITGVVVDAAGNPVADAFVQLIPDPSTTYALHEFIFESWWFGEQPILTGVDGAFTATKLPIGKSYTIRASRKGGAIGYVEHIPVGGTAKIEIKPTGAIAGTVRSWNSTLDELTINLRETTTGFTRYERFFRTNGEFAIDDLPAGRFAVTAGAEGKESSVEVEVREGERKAGVVIELVSLVTLTGRAVDHLTGEPVAKVNFAAHPVGGVATGFALPYDASDRGRITDENGRFTIKRAPLGKLVLNARPRDPGYSETSVVRTIAGSTVIELGDIPIIRQRGGPDDQGWSGISFANFSDQIENWQVEVSGVEANSPAAKAGIKVGDIITSIDGVDTRGWAGTNAYWLMSAPAGTKLSFTLARGVTVDIVLAKRP